MHATHNGDMDIYGKEPPQPTPHPPLPKQPGPTPHPLPIRSPPPQPTPHPPLPKPPAPRPKTHTRSETFREMFLDGALPESEVLETELDQLKFKAAAYFANPNDESEDVFAFAAQVLAASVERATASSLGVSHTQLRQMIELYNGR